MPGLKEIYYANDPGAKTACETELETQNGTRIQLSRRTNFVMSDIVPWKMCEKMNQLPI